MGWAAASRAEGDTDALEELRFHWGGAYDIDVDEDRALEALRLAWGDADDIGHEYGKWIATSRDEEKRTITGETPGRAKSCDPGWLGAGGHAVRFRENNPADVARARAAVAAWRDQNPAGAPGSSPPRSAASSTPITAPCSARCCSPPTGTGPGTSPGSSLVRR
jgi:hypothetical protein